jgi:hypothetical protein
MQQEFDVLDKLIEDSREEVKLSSNYNHLLMAKMKKKQQSKNQSYTFAFSLILAGFLLMFIYTSDFQYKLFDMQCKIKSDISVFQDNFKLFNIKGE